MKSEASEHIEISGERLKRIEETVAPLLSEADQTYLQHVFSIFLRFKGG